MNKNKTKKVKPSTHAFIGFFQCLFWEFLMRYLVYCLVPRIKMNDTLCRYLNSNNSDGPLQVRTYVIICMHKCTRMSNTNAKPHF